MANARYAQQMANVPYSRYRPTRRTTSDDWADEGMGGTEVKEWWDQFNGLFVLDRVREHLTRICYGSVRSKGWWWPTETPCLDRSGVENLDDSLPQFVEGLADFFTQPDKIEFKSQLLIELEAEPVEDAVVHIAEFIIQDAFKAFPRMAGESIAEAFEELLLQGKSLQAAGLLQCLGRISGESVRATGKQLVLKGLSHKEAALREAAVCVIEQWEDEELLGMLRQYRNDPLPWLASYISRVLEQHEVPAL